LPPTLADRVVTLAGTLDSAELNNLRLLLGMAAGTLVPSEETGQEPRASLRTTLACLSAIRNGKVVPDRGGLLYRGRPDWFSGERLNELIQESHDRRPVARLYERQFVAGGGTIADELARSNLLLDLVRAASNGMASPTGIASYLYYDAPGMGIVPHVDTEVFALNALFLLVHEGRSVQSSLVVYPPTGPPLNLRLSPGEVVVLDANAVVHGRSSVGPEERVHVLTIGFRPEGADGITPFAL